MDYNSIILCVVDKSFGILCNADVTMSFSVKHNKV